MQGEKMVLNMGPSHPATHGVLRIVLELDGEIITKAMPDVGYLHRGDEKIAENMTYTQFIPYTDRLDYLAPLANNVAYALAVEKLLGIDKQLPPRCQFIRVICCELARISAHLLGLGRVRDGCRRADVFLHTFTEREKIYNLCEVADRRAFHHQLHAHRRAVARSAAGLGRAMPQVSATKSSSISTRSEKLLTRNRIFVDRTQGVGVISKEDAIDYGLTGPNLRGSGVEHDLRKAHPYLVYDQLEFDVPVGRWAIATIVIWCAWKKCVRACASCINAWINCPAAPVNVPDRKIVLPPKDTSADADGGTDPPFHPRDPGRQCAAGRNLFRRTKIRRANSVFTSTAKAAARRTG